VMTQPPPDLRALGVAPGLVEVIEAALAKAPAERPQTAEELRARLDAAAAAGPVAAVAPPASTEEMDPTELEAAPVLVPGPAPAAVVAPPSADESGDTTVMVPSSPADHRRGRRIGRALAVGAGALAVLVLLAWALVGATSSDDDGSTAAAKGGGQTTTEPETSVSEPPSSASSAAASPTTGVTSAPTTGTPSTSTSTTSTSTTSTSTTSTSTTSVPTTSVPTTSVPTTSVPTTSAPDTTTDSTPPPDEDEDDDGKSPTKGELSSAVDDYYGIVAAGDLEQSYDLLTASFQQRQSFEEYQAFWNSVDSVSVQGRGQVDLDSLTTAVTLRYALGGGGESVEDVVLGFVEADGTLLIDSYEVVSSR